MPEVSAVSTSSALGSYETTFEEEQKEEQTFLQSPSEKGESEKMMKEQEILHRMTAPNLRTLDKREAIKAQINAAQSPYEAFALIIELVKVEVQALKRKGVSIKDFAQGISDKKQSESFQFDSEYGQIKTQIIECYEALTYSCIMMKKFAKINTDLLNSYSCPYLQLYELEKEVGLNLTGSSLLEQELEAHTDILLPKINSNVPVQGYVDFYWGKTLPSFLKILAYLEKDGAEDILKDIMKSAVLKLCFSADLSKKITQIDNRTDPLLLFFPYVVKYTSLDAIKDYFEIRFKDLSQWEKVYRWIELHCSAAEILAPLDREKAESYLKKAKQEVETKMWTYPFSSNRTHWNTAKEEALTRIKLAELSLSKSGPDTFLPSS